MLARHFFHTTGALHNHVSDTAGIRTRSPGSMSLARSHLSYGATDDTCKLQTGFPLFE